MKSKKTKSEVKLPEIPKKKQWVKPKMTVMKILNTAGGTVDGSSGGS